MQSALEYVGPSRLRANQLFRADLLVKLREEVRTGGRIVLATRHMSDLGDPQTSRPGDENFISIQSPHETALELGSLQDWKRHPWNRGIDLRLVRGNLPAGSEIKVRLGDSSGGCPGYRCQSFIERRFRFRLGIDTDGHDSWIVAAPEDSPGFAIIGGPAVCLSVFVTDATGSSNVMNACITGRDAYGNIAGDDAGVVRLLLDDTISLGTAVVSAGAPTVIQIPFAHDQRWHTLTAAKDDGSLMTRSNPFGPSPLEGQRLFFGEIHGQSEVCDGTGSPAELYSHARDAAGLDFASVTSHDFEMTPEDWQQIKSATRSAHQDGRFVTFLGYEWSGRTERGGDNNIYFLDDDAPLIYNGRWPGHPQWEPAARAAIETRTIAQTIEQLRGRDFMVVPHCGGRRCNLDFFDPQAMPMLEMHSCHRNYEHVAGEAISRGLHVGFIGGSDDHRGALGDSHLTARDRFFSSHSGLVAVYARDLTRQALWEAFFARRVYATNGPRIILDFRVNNVPMGGEVSVRAGETLNIQFWTRLDGLLDRVELLSNTQVIQSFVAETNTNKVPEFSGQWTGSAVLGSSCYWLRVRQTDGGTAWASPVWVAAS